MRVLDYKLFIDSSIGHTESNPQSDREQIILPEAWMRNLNDMQEIERSIFDMLWRSFYFEKCPYYNEDGTRKNL